MRPSLIPSLLLVILTALAFWPARTATFLHYDDPGHVTNNPYILPPTAASLAYFWRYPFDRSPVPGVASTAGRVLPPYEQIYSPIAFTTWGLLAYVARVAPTNGAQGEPQRTVTLDPSIYHSFNLVLHVLNVMLVFALLRRFVKQEWAASLGAALFALHPVQVEPVAWVTGMNNLLSGFFALAALLLYLKNKDESENPRWISGAYWGSTFCFLLSVLSKPSSVTLPVLALLLCWGLGEKQWRSRLMEMVPWAAIVLFCVGVNKMVANGIDYHLKPMTWQKPFLIGDALTFYGTKLFLPWHLAPDYGRRPEWVMAQPQTYVIWLVPVVVTGCVWFWWRRTLKQGPESQVARFALLSLAFFGLVLLPSSGIVTYYFHLISTVSDRYMYMALVGPALLVAVVAAQCAEMKNKSLRDFLAVLSLGLVATLTVLSFKQAEFWQSDLPLWAHNVAVVPQSTVAYYQYGVALYDGHDYKAAIPILEQGVRANPANWLGEISLANAYVQVSELGKAESHYRHALVLFPDAVNAHLGIGVVLAQQGKVAEAIDQFGQGLRLQPENPLLLAYMGQNLTKIGKNADAIGALRAALAYGFVPAKGHLYLGNALAQAGNVPEAMKEWDAAIQSDPNSYEAYSNMGAEFAKAGNANMAIQTLERAIQIQPRYARAQVQLGLSWQKLGQKEKARAAFLAALQSDPQNILALKALRTIK